MPYDLFISYSRKDNLNNRVTELKNQIETDYLEFAKEELNCFFDQKEIHGMDDWEHRLLQGLKESHLLLVILSPNYLASPYCEWEIVEYLKYEYSRGVAGDGVAQVYFMEIPGIDDEDFKSKAAAWLEKVSRRQRIDLRPWYDEGANSLKREDVKRRLSELKESLRKRITRMRVISEVPGNLPAPNPRFVGREREMEMLHKATALGQLGVITAVHGVGGLGKTAIAFQYAYAYANFYPGGRWYLGCANETNLASVIKRLDSDLNITLTEDEKKDDTRGAKRILNELFNRAVENADKANKKSNSATSDKEYVKPAVLLILDNVDHTDLIQPPYSDIISGKEWLKVLVTTRMGPKELGGDETTQKLLTIDELPFEDGVSLIESYQPGGRFKSIEEKEKAGEIVNLLGGFTLAVEVTAIYLGECGGRVSCTAFVELLKREGAVAGIDIVGQRTKKAITHNKLVSATLNPTLDLLQPQETLILNYASLLPPDSIPLPWIKALVSQKFPELGKPALAGIDDPWISTINHLLSLRLLQIVDLDTDGLTPRLIRIHRLVQETNKLRIENTSELLQKICDFSIVRSEFLEKNWHVRQNQWEIKPLVDLADQLLHLKNPFAPKFVKWLGQWLLFISAHKKYLELHLKAIEILNETPDSEKTEIAILLSNLGGAYSYLGNILEARKCLKSAIEIDEQFREPTHLFLAIRYLNLASIERNLGNLKEAKELILKALAIREKVFDQDHPDLASCYGSLGRIEQDLGNLKEAKELILKALAIREKVFDQDHPDLASCYGNLGSIEQDLGNLKEAKELKLKALAIREKVFDQDHPDLAISYDSLGSIEQDLGNLKEAKELKLKALAIREKVFDQNHPELASSYNNLGRIEQDLGNLKEAKELFLKAIAIWEKVYIEDHPHLATGYSSLGRIEQDLGNLKEAKELFLKAIAIRVKVFDQNHPDLATSYNNLGRIEQDLGNLKEAKEFFLKTIEIDESNYETNHPALSINYTNLGMVEIDLGNTKSAETLLRRSLEIRIHTSGIKHKETANAYANLSRGLINRGNISEAEKCATIAISIWKQFEPQVDYKLGKAFWTLGLIEMGRSNHISARQHLTEALRLLRLGLKEDHLWVCSVKKELDNLNGKFSQQSDTI